MYSSKTYYYFAIAEDLVLRLGWAAKLILTEFLVNSRGRPLVEPTVVTSVLAFLEIFRRFVWNFFRLENEHLNNCGESVQITLGAIHKVRTPNFEAF